MVLPHLDLGDLELEVLEVADPDFPWRFPVISMGISIFSMGISMVSWDLKSDLRCI